jgi:adenosylmethionine-8-amino-7-oxononanoate aminotransferase
MKKPSRQAKRSTLAKIDRQYLWHPFTQMQNWSDPLVIVRGKGNYLYDENGKKYLDGVSSLWVTVHGHQKKELDAALKRQLGKIAHSTLLGLANEPSTLLAEQLIKIAPKGLKKVFYSDDGSTSVEIALKMAFQYWQNQAKNKTKFVTLTNAYHGDTIGSVSVGGIDLFHQIYKPLLFKSYKVAPDPSAIERLFKAKHSEIAAIVMEPLVQGAAGMLLEPKGLLKQVRALCDQYNILMIVDEVATGFGRTGKMFACEHEKVTPDLMCVAKGLTGGYLPVAATLTKEKIYRAFLAPSRALKTFFHGHTYTGNPLGSAVALANLEIFKREQTIARIQPVIKHLSRGLAKLKTPKIKEIRQLGLMVGVEVNGPVGLGAKICAEIRKHGVILRPLDNTVVIMPPLSITKGEIDFLLKALSKSIRMTA